jgi:NTP pyrophosphatase (non-canonical NTP hydrolase)
MDTIFKISKDISRKNDSQELSLRITKLAEELGELSAAYLKKCHYKPRKGLSITMINENIREEACDVVLVAFDILHILGIDQEEASKRIMEKCQKWEDHIKVFNGQLHKSPNPQILKSSN